MADIPIGPVAADVLAGLRSRSAALRRAAGNPRARQQALLDAALTELEGAIEALTAAARTAEGTGRDDHADSALHSDRRLLQAAFTQAPLPLVVIDGDATVRRANLAACDLFGVGPGYATGKALTAMIEAAGQAPVRTQLAAVLRTGNAAVVSCSLVSGAGLINCQLAMRPLGVRGDDDRVLVALSPDGAGDGLPRARRSRSGKATADSVDRQAADEEISLLTQRADLLAAAARLLLEDGAASESVILQRCARLLAAELATWVIVDVRRRGTLRRHFVAGPDDPTSARLAQVVAAVAPEPGTVSFRVYESGSSDLVTHAEDDELLGTGADGMPLLALLSVASVLAVPVFDGPRGYGVLTLIRDAAAGPFRLGDVGLTEQVAELLARAMSARRMLSRQTEAAQAFRSSLLPPVLRAIPGVDIAAAHMAPTRGREVGGDFYDVYPTPDGWGVAIGDVCGKGDDAAAATAAARHAIRVLAHWNPDPAQVLRGANDIMLTEEFGSRFVTADAAHLRWDDRTLRVRLGSAGHPGPVLLKPDGRAQLLAGGGVALGIFPDPEPSVSELELESGDVLFFFTDGLTGARGAQQGYFEGLLADTLAPLAGRHAADIVAEMRKVVLDFSAGVLLDDLTMLALEVGLPPGS